MLGTCKGLCNRDPKRQIRRIPYIISHTDPITGEKKHTFFKYCESCEYFISVIKDINLRCCCCGRMYRTTPHGNSRNKSHAKIPTPGTLELMLQAKNLRRY